MRSEELIRLTILLRKYADEYCTTHGLTWREHNELADHCYELAMEVSKKEQI